MWDLQLYRLRRWGHGQLLGRLWSAAEGVLANSASTGYELQCLVAAYEAIGFKECSESHHEPGFDKVAIYANHEGKWTHAAHLREDGWWESKLGELEDIIHRTPQGLAGDAYGEVALYMKRTVHHRVRFHLEKWLAKKKQPDFDLNKAIEIMCRVRRNVI